MMYECDICYTFVFDTNIGSRLIDVFGLFHCNCLKLMLISRMSM